MDSHRPHCLFSAACHTLFHLEHGHVDYVGEDTTFGSTIPIVCNEGYEIQGQDHIYCGEDGIWIGSIACRPAGNTILPISQYDLLAVLRNGFRTHRCQCQQKYIPFAKLVNTSLIYIVMFKLVIKI